MTINRRTGLPLLVALVALNSCKWDKSVKVPDFDQTVAHAAVRSQVQFGPRVPGSDAHSRCKEWLVAEFKNNGATVTDQDFKAKTFDGKEFDAHNIIASYNIRARQRIIIAAHWDSRPFSDQEQDTSLHHTPVSGADDGASGVGIILAVSNLLGKQPLEKIGVDLVLFDAEDYGANNGEMETWCLGSQYWSKNPHVADYKADYGILLDMVGGANPSFNKEEYSLYFAPRVVEKVWKIAHGEGLDKVFVNVNGTGLVDDHIFVNRDARIPMIDIINRPPGSKTGFVTHWHTQKDDMNAIDPNTLGAVGRVLTKLLYWEDKDKI
ncbi:MAG: M28 family peptidase [Saprospiraceae bacterium]